MAMGGARLTAVLLGAGAIAVFAAGGPQQAWTKLTAFGTQLKSDTSASVRPASQAGTGGPKAGGPPQAPAVTVSKPLVRQVTEWDEYTGRFEAVATVDVRARVSGYLNSVHFVDGQKVAKGDLLFMIDPRPFERALDQAKAEFDQAKTKVENASLDVERGRPLVDRKIMSEKVFDDRSNLMREAQAALRVAEAKVKTAELDLFFTKITSPIAGRTSRAGLSAGGWVSAGSASNSTLLTSIVAEDPIHVYFDIDENNWLKYRRMLDKSEAPSTAMIGTEIELALPDEKGYPHKGRIDFVDNRLDQSTGTMRARAVVANAGGLFSAGMFVRLRVKGSQAYDAVMIPDAAIGSDQSQKFVLVVADDNSVSRKVVDLGPLIDGLRVVRSGLTASDTIVTKGLQRVRPGPGVKVAPKIEPLRVSGAPAPDTSPVKAAGSDKGAPK
ncbi:MAG TPA: efflux RND transporter periplasmic adaptor subunit [Hyphomicrobiaceae bacterium]|nr:efflux RND transporter periplasmic adaptor subunit [Hyphomicrobiaceae bacterium]